LNKKLIAIFLDQKNIDIANRINFNKKDSIFIIVSKENINKNNNRNCIFLQIKEHKFKKTKYQDTLTIFINSLIEIGIYEFINKFQIYKSLQDYSQNIFLDLIIKKSYYINPIAVLKNDKDIICKISKYFNIDINLQYFINKYIKTRMKYKNGYFKITETFFLKRNIQKLSLGYFQIENFFNFKDIFISSLLWKIPNNFKTKIKKIFFQKIAKKNYDEVYTDIFSETYRNKMLLYRYINLLNYTNKD